MLLNILPIGNIEAEIIQMLKERLKHLPFRISVLDMVEVPPEALDANRNQYDCAPFMKLIHTFPGDKVLGVTDVDLFAETLNFVFGRAEISKKAAIISTYRLKGDKETYQNRIVKEAVHELGHTMGIRHCEKASCVMHYSNCLEETDIKEDKFCPGCEKRLRWAKYG